MSEAETWTSSVFPKLTNSVNSTQVEPENQLLSLIPEQQLPHAGTTGSMLANLLKTQVENINSVKLETVSPWVDVESLAAMPSHASSSALSELFKLISLIQEMRAANGSLTKQVMQLEQALSQSQNSVQLHKQQAQATVSQLAQTTDKLAEAQAQATSLAQDLATAEQTAQTWQRQFAALSSQFESSQERVAQMERECATTQANYIEQSHQLQQSETTCRELRTRLTRQQRQTLQLKVALEKCLEAPVPSYTDNNYSFTNSSYEPAGYWVSPEASAPTSNPEALLPKTQPIPPWSAPAEFSGFELLNSGASADAISYDWTAIDSTEPAPPAIAATPTIDLPQFTSDLAVDSANQVSAETEASWQELYEQLLGDSAPAVTKKSAVELPQPNGDRPVTNWPAPVVYPCRPPQGRKSLAAIELPTFGLNRVDRNARAV